jgi:hypothetical protein
MILVNQLLDIDSTQNQLGTIYRCQAWKSG